MGHSATMHSATAQGADPAAMEPGEAEMRWARERVNGSLLPAMDEAWRRREVYATTESLLAAAVEDIASAACRGDWDEVAASVRYGRAIDVVRTKLAGGRKIRDIR
jgi:hypothetical protein